MTPARFCAELTGLNSAVSGAYFASPLGVCDGPLHATITAPRRWSACSPTLRAKAEAPKAKDLSSLYDMMFSSTAVGHTRPRVYLLGQCELPLVHVLLKVVHRGLQPLSLCLLEREHHLPGAGAPLRLLHLFAKLILLRFPSLSHDVPGPAHTCKRENQTPLIALD